MASGRRVEIDENLNTKSSYIANNNKNIHEAKISLDQIENAKDRKRHIKKFSAVNKGPKIGCRHVQVSLVFLCMTVGLAMRTNLSVAIVAMTDPTASPNADVPTYNWTNQSVILSSFFWGYICLQVLAGYLGKTYGPKFFLLPAFFMNSIAFMFIPLAAEKLDSVGVMICRVIQGLCQGFMFPSGHTMLGKWAPADEMSFMGIIVYSGVSCGSILSSIVTGYLSSSSVGWPASFYIFGGMGVAWCVLFLIFGYDSPAKHPSITQEEKRYIEESLGQTEDNEFVPVPWKSILTSIHLWAIVVANIGNSWGYAMMMTQIPTYLAYVLEFNIKDNGLVSAIPYMVGTITGLMFAPFVDHIIRKGYISRLNARRLSQLFGSNGLMICLLLLAYVADTKVLAIIVLALGNAANSASLVGYSVNHVDLSPRFSGIMQGISNATSQAFSIFSPLLVQFVVKDKGDATQWRLVFIVAAALYCFTSIFYATFASATRQKWNGPVNETTEKMERMKRASVISVTGY